MRTREGVPIVGEGAARLLLDVRGPPLLGPARHAHARLARHRDGAFEGHTNTTVKMHFFVEEKGDSYEITDGLPQHER
ncbi:hypothetical protein MVI01_50450 [Myxococcus virescens]|uniref:Uncharacterized protein n=1 Tax=Myxococcus virescens TaxID=83456 RepID=A0A511HI72_9BACT|nr:hypothetical protein MVI01_50450 [Myxococcus virescens]